MSKFHLAFAGLDPELGFRWELDEHTPELTISLVIALTEQALKYLSDRLLRCPPWWAVLRDVVNVCRDGIALGTIKLYTFPDEAKVAPRAGCVRNPERNPTYYVLFPAGWVDQALSNTTADRTTALASLVATLSFVEYWLQQDHYLKAPDVFGQELMFPDHVSERAYFLAEVIRSFV